MSKASRTSYSTIEVAKRLGVSLQTIQRWVDAGHLKAWKTPGGHRRIDAASAERLFGVQAEQLPSLAEPVGPARVLIVDDDDLDREILSEMVRRIVPDAVIETAVDGFQGLIAVGRLAPQVVITDLHMPFMDGIEMIRRLLAAQTRPEVVVAVSALPPKELAASPLPAEVPCLSKPVDEARLAEALRRGPGPAGGLSAPASPASR